MGLGEKIASRTLLYLSSASTRVASRIFYSHVAKCLGHVTNVRHVAASSVLSFSSLRSASMASSASSSGCSKRPRIESDTSKHLVAYRASWENEFSWLSAVESDGQVTGMLCRLCQRHKTKNKFNQSSVWSSTPCVSFGKDVRRRHAKSDQHNSAVELESHRVAPERDGGILQAFQSQISLQHKATQGYTRLSREPCSVYTG